ncbi:MAG: ribonuclease HII [Candidatus Adlerbacteria bacterium]|nr:ribonuclease HII [Candidatus Adlerbacteria bacterium]
MVKILIGVDEAGRGPLAGPVAIGVVSAPENFDIKKAFPGVGDSKKVTEKKREEIYARACIYRKEGKIDFCVEFSSAQIIDTVGITKAVRGCVYKGVKKLSPDTKNVHVLLDGLLHAPPEYAQQTIIRGDASEPVISLASIVAKVSRDRLMCRRAGEFPEYSFEVHKGYGTKAHRDAIQKFGLSEMHRKTFCH